jgi:hypothetical protein
MAVDREEKTILNIVKQQLAELKRDEMLAAVRFAIK